MDSWYVQVGVGVAAALVAAAAIRTCPGSESFEHHLHDWIARRIRAQYPPSGMCG
jgi:hypothetical protein